MKKHIGKKKYITLIYKLFLSQTQRYIQNKKKIKKKSFMKKKII